MRRRKSEDAIGLPNHCSTGGWTKKSQAPVTSIKRDAIMAQIDVDIGVHKITAVITRDALDKLGLRIGDTAIALVKATEVMIVKD